MIECITYNQTALANQDGNHKTVGCKTHSKCDCSLFANKLSYNLIQLVVQWRGTCIRRQFAFDATIQMIQDAYMPW